MSARVDLLSEGEIIQYRIIHHNAVQGLRPEVQSDSREMGGILVIRRNQQRAARQIHIKFHRVILPGKIRDIVVQHASRPAVCHTEGHRIRCIIIGSKTRRTFRRAGIFPRISRCSSDCQIS